MSKEARLKLVLKDHVKAPALTGIALSARSATKAEQDAACLRVSRNAQRGTRELHKEIKEVREKRGVDKTCALNFIKKQLGIAVAMLLMLITGCGERNNSLDDLENGRWRDSLIEKKHLDREKNLKRQQAANLRPLPESVITDGFIGWEHVSGTTYTLYVNKSSLGGSAISVNSGASTSLGAVNDLPNFLKANVAIANGNATLSITGANLAGVRAAFNAVDLTDIANYNELPYYDANAQTLAVFARNGALYIPGTKFIHGLPGEDGDLHLRVDHLDTTLNRFKFHFLKDRFSNFSSLTDLKLQGPFSLVQIQNIQDNDGDGHPDHTESLSAGDYDMQVVKFKADGTQEASMSIATSDFVGTATSGQQALRITVADGIMKPVAASVTNTSVAINAPKTTLVFGTDTALFLTPILTLSSGHLVSARQAGSWASGTTSTATIDASTGKLTVVGVGTTVITYTIGSLTDTITITVSSVLNSIAITPATATVEQNQSQTFLATGTFNDGTSRTLTASEVNFTIVNTALGSINSGTGSFTATGTAVGTTTVRATSTTGVVGTAQLTVTKVVSAVALDPSAGFTLLVGNSKQFISTTTFTDGSSETSTSKVTWASSDTTVGTVSASGLFTAIKGGTTTVSATQSGKTATVIMTVVSGSATMEVTPNADQLVIIGATQQFTATLRFADGTTRDVSQSVTWKLSSTGIASISGAGLLTGLAKGAVSVTATNGPTTSNAVTVNVTPSVSSISITTPSTTTLTVEVGQTSNFIALLNFSDSTTADGTSTVTWNSTTTATGSLNTSGVFTALAVGTTSVTATSGSVSSTAVTVTVTPKLNTLAISGGTTATVGTDLTLTITGTFSDSTTSTSVTGLTVAVSDATKASITTAGGVLTPLKAGTVTVTATKGTVVSNVFSVTISAVSTGISVGAASVTVAPAATSQIVVTESFNDSTTADATATSTYSSSNTSFATVSSAGLITGVTTGTATITVTKGSFTATVAVTVTTATETAIAVTSSLSFVDKGTSTHQFGVTITLSDSSTSNSTAGVTFSSSNATVGTVSSTGVFTALAEGQTQIQVTKGSLTSTQITVHVFGQVGVEGGTYYVRQTLVNTHIGGTGGTPTALNLRTDKVIGSTAAFADVAMTLKDGYFVVENSGVAAGQTVLINVNGLVSSTTQFLPATFPQAALTTALDADGQGATIIDNGFGGGNLQVTSK